ncbi:unnamed protein product [Parajaminaea phylloscopi]
MSLLEPLRSTTVRAMVPGHLIRRQVRSLHSSCSRSLPASDPESVKDAHKEEDRHRHQYNVDPFTLEPSREHYTLPFVTAHDLAKSNQRPRGVRMLTRDFIHDSLYNPHYGYFSRHAVLLPESKQFSQSGRKGWDFAAFKNDEHFLRAVEERYIEFEKGLPHLQKREDHFATGSSAGPSSSTDQPTPQSSKGRSTRGSRKPSPTSAAGLDAAKIRGRAAFERSQREDKNHDADVQSMVARQVWHTPTELFKPHYASIIAEHCVSSSRIVDQPDMPLVIYEFGAGSGAMAEDFLDYLAQRYPDVYRRTQYNIVEISQRLADQQRKRLTPHRQAGRVQVHNGDFLEWDRREDRDCFVIGLEVLDNLSHDAVRYSTSSLEPYQTLVSIDSTGDMHELFVPASDPLITRYLSTLSRLRPKMASHPPGLPKYLPSLPAPLRRSLSDNFPLFPNLSPEPHFLPTHTLKLLDTLRTKFPRRRIILSDFSSLPDSLPGVNAPVVQTRIEGTAVDVRKYTVLQGFFDIFFPTDFDLLRDFYLNDVIAAAGSPATGGESSRLDAQKESPRAMSHRDFLASYPELAQRCNLAKKGENPMLSWYQNASWLIS